MRDWCDFAEQENTFDGEGNPLRPDLIVNLPNGRTLVIDAKTNVEAYLDAIDATNPEDAESLYDPANDKVYRYPTFYNLPDEVGHM